MTYRKKITLAFIAYSLLLTIIYSVLIWGTLFTTEDYLYEHLLEQYYIKIYEQYDKENSAVDLQEPLISHEIYAKEAVPEHLKSLSKGFIEVEENHILVKPLKNDRILFLSLPGIDGLSDKIEPLIISLLFIFSVFIIVCGTIIALVLARQLSRPIEHLVHDVKNANLDTNNMCREGNSYELNMLARSFNEVMLHIQTSLKREKSFTQSVSHELRTPLTVLKTNLDILQAHKQPLTIIDRVTDRMLRATNSMSNLTTIFLALARHDKFTEENKVLNAGVIIQSTIAAADTYKVHWDVQCQSDTEIHSPEDIFEILLSNIIDNGNKYADGNATIIVTDDYLETHNQIKINKQRTASSQLGIMIIERICDALGWRMTHKLDGSLFHLRIDFHQKPILTNEAN